MKSFLLFEGLPLSSYPILSKTMLILINFSHQFLPIQIKTAILQIINYQFCQQILKIRNMNEKDDIKWKLQIIFVYYTGYADRNNYKLLKQQNYRRFLIDSETVKSETSLVHFDIAFQKVSNTAIVFKEFLNLIPELACLLFRQKNRAEAFKLYMHNHIEPLYLDILANSQYGQDINTIFQTTIDRKIQKRLIKISVTQRAFNEYISSSINKQYLSLFQTVSNFFKDFEVSPHLISKSTLFILFLFQMRCKKQSDTFTLEDFVRIFVYIAEVCSRKITNVQLCSNSKMVKLLERMEISVGFDKISKKIMYETAINPSFLKYFLDDKSEEDSCIQKINRVHGKISPTSMRHNKCNDSLEDVSGSRKQVRQHLRTESYQTATNLLQENEENGKSFEQFKVLKQKFEQLCEYGEVANSKTLKSLKIKRLFQKIEVLPIITQAWLDIQCVNLQRSSQSGKIEFPQFLELLSLVSKKINIPFENLLDLILDQSDTGHFGSQVEKRTSKVMNISEEEQKLLKDIIQTCEKQIYKIYKTYSMSGNLLSFDELAKMMYDLDVFPSIISKSKLYQIFSDLNDGKIENVPLKQKSKDISFDSKSKSKSPLKKSKQIEGVLKSKKRIDFPGFLMGLIQVSEQICDENLEIVQKLIILLEKINDSEGYKRITNVSLVHSLRKKFSSYYLQSLYQKQRHVEDFQQLLNNFS